MKKEKYHYTYKVTLEETGEFYIGVRSSKSEPHLDNKYKGSMVSWKVDKSKLKKEILGIYKTRKEANEKEISLLMLYKKQNKDSLCKNAHIPSVGFCMNGIKLKDRGSYKIEIYVNDKLDRTVKSFVELRRYLLPVTCDFTNPFDNSFNTENKESLQTREQISEIIRKKKSFKIENFIWIEENEFDYEFLTEEEQEYYPRTEIFEVKLEVVVKKNFE